MCEPRNLTTIPLAPSLDSDNQVRRAIQAEKDAKLSSLDKAFAWALGEEQPDLRTEEVWSFLRLAIQNIDEGGIGT